MNQRRSQKYRRSRAYRSIDTTLSRRSAGPDTRESPAHSAERLAQQVQLGVDSLQQQRHHDAEQYFLAALQTDPHHALANNCLGILYRSLGRVDEAIRHYRQALRSNPNYHEAHNNLGIAYEAKGELELAVASYRAALHCNADFAAAHSNLGNAYTKQEKFDWAVECFDRALRLQPTFAAAFNNRGLALRELDRDYDAEASFREAIKAAPRFSEPYLNLGHILHRRRSPEAAIECFQAAIQYKPESAEAYCSLGHCLRDLRRHDEAFSAFEAATRVAPRCAEAWFGLGVIARTRGDHEESINYYRKAITYRPNYPEARNNLANELASLGEINNAINVLEEAVHLAEHHLPSLNNLGNLYRLQDRLSEAADCYRRVMAHRDAHPLNCLRFSTLCPTVFESSHELEDYAERSLTEWTNLEGAQRYGSLQDLLLVANEPPYNLQFFPMNIRPWKEAYARIFDYAGPEYELRQTGTPYRLGFVVTSQHEIAFLRLIWDAIRQLDPDEFQLTIVCTADAAPKFRNSVSPKVDILPLPEKPNEVIQRLVAQQFDLLYYFEICTDILNYFLPYFRLAPVQCTSWGIQVTSGIPNVDYYLSSHLIEPENGQEHYSEELALAETILAYQTPVQLPAQSISREDFGFTAADHIYLSPQHLGKFHPDVDPLLAGILRRDERAVVAITSDRHGYGAKQLKARFQSAFPDVIDRVRFLPRQNLPNYLGLVAAADVLLDPPHFGGVNTTYDALALHQPIVSWPSELHRGRYTYGCYQKMGLLDCVAHSADEYVEIATRLGTDREYRTWIRGELADRKGRVFTDHSAVSEHARLFRNLIARARSQ